jgi:DNA-binding transcriptional LysR family regulator
MLNHAHLARIDFNLLLVFDLLFEERNATRAAVRLHLSPSAISHALRRLRSTLNDPLFLPTAKGMVPTERAESLAPAIREIVEGVGRIVESGGQFDPATAVRTFRIGGPDAAISVLIPPLVRKLIDAPAIGLSMLNLLPSPGSVSPSLAWGGALAELDSRRIDVAILPHRPDKDRFRCVPLYSEDFVITTRDKHPLGRRPSLEAFASAAHVLVSATGDATGIVDLLLAEHGLRRRIALTVPSFHMAAAAIASSDLITAIPRRFAEDAARHYSLAIVEPPVPVTSTDLHIIVPKAAMLDDGIAWLVERLCEACSDTRFGQFALPKCAP